jgi:hypothetical protein
LALLGDVPATIGWRYAMNSLRGWLTGAAIVARTLNPPARKTGQWAFSEDFGGRGIVLINAVKQ